jgi:hypothetical protein
VSWFRYLRQFHEGAQVLTLEKAVVRPDIPTTGGVLICAGKVDVVLHWESLAAVEAVRSAGWRDQTPLEPV